MLWTTMPWTTMPGSTMPWTYLGLGGLIGLVNGVFLIRLAAQIRPDADFNVRLRVFKSYGIRFGLLAAGFALAIRNGLAAGLAMFCGLWFVRWVIVWVGCAGVIDWTWFDVSSQGVG